MFVEKILSTGIEIFFTPIKLIKINKKVSYSEGSKNILLDKSKVASEIDFEIKYQNKIIGTQRNKLIYLMMIKDILSPEHFVYMKMLKNLKVLV